eukprot:2891783-Prymnesium_polylepis.1
MHDSANERHGEDHEEWHEGTKKQLVAHRAPNNAIGRHEPTRPVQLPKEGKHLHPVKPRRGHTDRVRAFEGGDHLHESHGDLELGEQADALRERLHLENELAEGHSQSLPARRVLLMQHVHPECGNACQHQQDDKNHQVATSIGTA